MMDPEKAVLLLVLVVSARVVPPVAAENNAQPRAFVGLDGDDNVLLESANDVHVRGRRLLLNGRNVDSGSDPCTTCPEAQRLELRTPTRTYIYIHTHTHTIYGRRI
mgnify:CR=1 FL=1